VFHDVTPGTHFASTNCIASFGITLGTGAPGETPSFERRGP
jgi:hypothetical protein